MQVPLLLRKNQGRKVGLNAKTRRHQQPITTHKVGVKNIPPCPHRSTHPARDCSESGGQERFPAMGWPMLPWLPFVGKRSEVMSQRVLPMSPKVSKAATLAFCAA